MNFGHFLIHLGHVLGILSGDDPTVTTLSTVRDLNNTKLTTPIILDTTTLANYYEGSTVSPKFFSTYGSTEHGVNGTSVVTGITAETGETGSDFTDTGSNTTFTDIPTDTGSNTTFTDIPTDPGNGTTITEPDTPSTGNGTTVTEPDTPSTGNGTTVTKPDTTPTGNGTTVTEPHTTPTGPHTTGTGPTDVPSPEKPGLSRGAVAGIVIGCLLLIAVIAAAVVFFVKNRNAPPEAQRLRV